MTPPKPRKVRLDVLLFDRGLVESRAKAHARILAGEVIVQDQRVDKPGTQVPDDAEVRFAGESLPFVSRGGLKLQAALERFAVIVRDAVCADIGASTGGFTDCLLQAGARKVYAVDVGYGQLHEKLRQDPRVISRERVNARYLDGSVLPEVVDVCVLDVSFISLTQVLPAVLPFLRPGGTLLALVKPQFEVGREGVGKGGVVRDGAVREAAIQAVCEFMERHGLRLTGRMDSPVPGPAGNVEALVAAIRA